MVQFKYIASSSALHSRAERGAVCDVMAPVKFSRTNMAEIYKNSFFELLMLLELLKLTAGGGLPLPLDSFSRSCGRNMSLGF
jgi:hypothetical protein